MVVGKTGKYMDFIWRVKDELFGGDLGNGELHEIRLDMSSDADYLKSIKDQLQAFYKRHDFEFTDRDCDALLHGFIKGMYPKDTSFFDSFTLFSKGKASVVDLDVLSDGLLTVTVAIRELKDSGTWETKNIYYKELSFNDLFN